MPEGIVHKRLKIVALAFLKRQCIDIVSTETKFRIMRSVSDACGINLKKKEVRVIEVKASLSDYRRDLKLFKLERSYYPHCNFFYIMCPTGVIKKEDVLKEFGLIYVDEDNNISVIQKPTKNKKLKTRFETTLKNSCRSITNDLVFKYHRITDYVKGFKYEQLKKEEENDNDDDE
jgi:hypothetical protein